ncbi:TPA: hypothetical protein ACRNLW_002144 [Pseudomonas aeruginosa]|uniref:hypothetical protein n=1 Tax=Pseudomonas aeruginosa TaxID=287 RepID=UPI000ACA10E9|nr:hypothetical protein [Pseudomonas aeruginosa]MBH8731549.1 hypothetical protein [Pseudomonas aeruginosa]MCS8383162.1 hypothetical protein [Pseudomonas aeruginosa]MCS8456770.1 hypothetical protein [Pseudomonas aeruginosa]MCS9277141.1 hypothetical protein [Pseudomonas aeruginosa]MCS9592657.1 hypothetical protein [Pseudomonas aeruginosa]
MIKRISCSVAFLLVVTAFPACAGIFNIGTSGGASSEGSSGNVVVRPDVNSARASVPMAVLESAPPQRMPMESTPIYQPYTPPAASVLPAPISDDAEVRRYDRYPNESDADYIARMKQVYRTSAAELERVGAEHLQRMQQLVPH